MLTVFRGDVRQLCDHRINLFPCVGAVHPFALCRVMAKPKCLGGSVCPFGPDWPCAKVTAACGADVFKDIFNAIRAVGAFVTADHRIRRVWRQIFVAPFTVWTQRQHYSAATRASSAQPIAARSRMTPCRRVWNAAKSLVGSSVRSFM